MPNSGNCFNFYFAHHNTVNSSLILFCPLSYLLYSSSESLSFIFTLIQSNWINDMWWWYSVPHRWGSLLKPQTSSRSLVIYLLEAWETRFQLIDSKQKHIKHFILKYFIIQGSIIVFDFNICINFFYWIFVLFSICYCIFFILNEVSVFFLKNKYTWPVVNFLLFFIMLDLFWQESGRKLFLVERHNNETNTMLCSVVAKNHISDRILLQGSTSLQYNQRRKIPLALFLYWM